MARTPAFAYPRKFAEISGLSAKEVRRLCQQQVIPNERTKGGFRIDVDGALAALRERAAAFSGHNHLTPTITVRTVRKRAKVRGKTFTDMINELKYAD